MMRSRAERSAQRPGAAMMEFAVVCPALFLILFAIIVGGFGVYRYQQVSALARDGARWASVRGYYYALETGQPMATEADIRDYIRMRSNLMDTDSMAVTAVWETGQIKVTVTYPWVPEAYLVGPIYLTSTSTSMPGSY